ncbi:MAG TPA: AAA family ATPase, partial [Actinomycetota bacterium]
MDAPTLVGRREELASLSNAFEGVGRSGSRIVIVEGDAGVGKTRLLAEHILRSRRRATTLMARGSPLSASMPFTTIAEALEGHLRSCDADELGRLVGDRRAALAAALPSVAARGGPSAGSGRDSSGGSVGRLAVLEALARLLGRLAEDRPVQLVLDDLHQADPSTWEWLGYLGRNPLAAPLLVVSAVRPYAVTERTDLWRLVSTLVKDGLARELRLRPLDSEDIAILADRALGAEVGGGELRSWLFDRTRGNALYAVGLLEQLRRDPAARVVPVSVKERVRMEIAELSPQAADAVELSAALGRSFALRQLEAAMPGAGTALDELVRRGLLVEQADASPGGSASYDFAHPLAQEAVYESMGAGRRREVHAQLAEALADELPAVRAYHVARSASTGDAVAIGLLQEAAELAERAQAHREALGHLRAALELTPPGHAERERLLDRIAWHAQEASDHSVALPALRELAELAEDDPVRLAATKMRLASSLSIGETDLAAAGDQAREAVASFERASSPRLAAAINELAWIVALGGDFGAQEELCRQAVALAEASGDEQTLLHALGPLAHGLAMRGRFEEARRLGARCMELASATGDALQIGWHAGIHAATFGYEGRFDEAAAVIDPVLRGAGDPGGGGGDRALDRGHPGDVAYDNAGWIRWFHGRWSDALAACRAVHALHP